MKTFRIIAIIICAISVVAVTIKVLKIDREFAEFSTYIVK